MSQPLHFSLGFPIQTSVRVTRARTLFYSQVGIQTPTHHVGLGGFCHHFSPRDGQWLTVNTGAFELECVIVSHSGVKKEIPRVVMVAGHRPL